MGENSMNVSSKSTWNLSQRCLSQIVMGLYRLNRLQKNQSASHKLLVLGCLTRTHLQQCKRTRVWACVYHANAPGHSGSQIATVLASSWGWALSFWLPPSSGAQLVRLRKDEVTSVARPNNSHSIPNEHTRSAPINFSWKNNRTQRPVLQARFLLWTKSKLRRPDVFIEDNALAHIWTQTSFLMPRFSESHHPSQKSECTAKVLGRICQMFRAWGYAVNLPKGNSPH